MNLLSFLKTNIYLYLAKGTNISYVSLGIIICLSSAMSFYIFMIYKLSTKNTFYCKEFNLLLSGMCIISSILTVTLHSSFLVFLGIISTLSLIRFRHAIKEPLELLYLFWSLCTGIFCGCQLYALVLLLAIFITVLFLLLTELLFSSNTYILTVESPQNIYDDIVVLLKPYCKYVPLNNISKYSAHTSYTFSIKTKKEDILLEKLAQIPSLTLLSFTSYNGEYRS